MKFLCPNCKAKYQISDEKIAGRTLKMDCRRCNHPIVIRAEQSAASSSASSSASGSQSAPSSSGSSASARRPSSPMSSPAPRRRSGSSHVGPAPSRSSSRGALGADFRKNAAAPAAPARPTALDQWHVAINDVPVGPMKRDEVARKIAAGAIDGASLSWREGFDDWRPLRDIPELAELLRRNQAPPPPPSNPGNAAFPAPSRSLGGRAPAPPRPARPPSGRSMPAAPRPAVESPRPSARGNVVPIGGRLGGSAAPALEDPENDEFEDDEPTRVGTAIDFEKMKAEGALDDARAGQAEARQAEASRQAEQARSAEQAERARRERGSEAALRSSAGLSASDSGASAPADPRGARGAGPPASGGAAGPTGLGGFAGLSDAFDPFASQGGAPSGPAPTISGSGDPRASAPGFAPAPGFAGPGAPEHFAGAPAHASSPVVSSEAVPAERRRRAIPIGAWIAIAGAMAFGVALAVMVGGRYLFPPAPVAAVTEPTPPTAPEVPVQPELVVPDPEVPVPDAPNPDAPGATDTEVVEASDPAPATEGAPTRPTTRPGTTGSPRPATRDDNLDEATRAALARMSDDDAAGAPNLAVSRPGVLDERPSAGASELNQDQIIRVVTRERAGVQRCYETAARASGQAPRMRVDVDVTIGGSGTVTSAVARGQSFGSLTECIERSVRRWRFPASGGVTRTSIPFVFQGRED